MIARANRIAMPRIAITSFSGDILADPVFVRRLVLAAASDQPSRRRHDKGGDQSGATAAGSLEP
jgi:hypothetical protein